MKYRWFSTFTGEVIEDFPSLVCDIARTVKSYWKQWDFIDVVKFVFCWKYSRAGF